MKIGILVKFTLQIHVMTVRASFSYTKSLILGPSIARALQAYILNEGMEVNKRLAKLLEILPSRARALVLCTGSLYLSRSHEVHF